MRTRERMVILLLGAHVHAHMTESIVDYAHAQRVCVCTCVFECARTAGMLLPHTNPHTLCCKLCCARIHIPDAMLGQTPDTWKFIVLSPPVVVVVGGGGGVVVFGVRKVRSRPDSDLHLLALPPTLLSSFGYVGALAFARGCSTNAGSVRCTFDDVGRRCICGCTLMAHDAHKHTPNRILY